MKKLLILFTLILFLCSPIFSSGTKEETKDEYNILVYIGGVLAGNPPYENLNNGALAFAKEHTNVKIKTYEAGFNQAEWESQLTSLVATGQYDFVLTTNPSLPEICDNISKKFPDQKFIITDAYFEGNKNIKTYLYNQYQQSVVLGHLAGLITTSDMEGANKYKKVGFILAQEYPLVTDDIIPGFIEGAKQVDKDIEVDIRTIGNWYDASKASEFTLSMINQGCDVFTSIAGGAAQGLLKTAKENNKYIVNYDINSYKDAPNTIVGCGNIKSVKLVEEILKKAIDGTLEFNKPEIIGIEEGYVDFFLDDPLFKQGLSDQVYNQFTSWYNKVKLGEIKIVKGN